MFSHEGPAIELLMFVFGLTVALLIVWFFHHQYERKNGKNVKNNIFVMTGGQPRSVDLPKCRASCFQRVPALNNGLFKPVNCRLAEDLYQRVPSSKLDG